MRNTTVSIILLTVSFAAIVVYAESNLDTKTRDFATFDFHTYEQVEYTSRPSLPIETGGEAIDYVLSQPETRKDLEYAIKNNGGKWKAEAKQVDGVWAVRIRNIDKLPPYLCFFEFDSGGKFLPSQPWAGCEYSK